MSGYWRSAVETPRHHICVRRGLFPRLHSPSRSADIARSPDEPQTLSVTGTPGWARLLSPEACTGGSRLWFPGLRLVFSKKPSSCGNLRGRRWVRTTGFSLVRRNRAGNLPSSERRLIRLTCGNHARRGPGVPGKVCTVVPGSGSRSSAHDHDSQAE
jgi:hypothetical protein